MLLSVLSAFAYDIHDAGNSSELGE
jgi:hypothetical protein